MTYESHADQIGIENLRFSITKPFGKLETFGEKCGEMR